MAQSTATLFHENRERRPGHLTNMNLQASPLHLKEATVTCIPRLRGGGGGGVGRRSRRRGGGGGSSAPAGPTQVSVLDRVRDVVLRLAMLSAATSSSTTSKGVGVGGRGGATLRQTATATPSRAEAARVSPAAYADSYRSEAVDDCIEFLKRSAAGRASSAATDAEEEAERRQSAAAAAPVHVRRSCAP